MAQSPAENPPLAAPKVQGFAPLADADAEVLILGSMPGRASLAAGAYYAHPQNAFWPIIGQLLDLDPGADYRTRVAALKAARIALWDVLHSCSRPGSLDARIAPESEVANDFTDFLARHPRITRICFNGAKAETSFRRRVLTQLDARPLTLLRLPSTSPAHARLNLAEKSRQWRAILAVPTEGNIDR